jgi:transmembrane sensor
MVMKGKAVFPFGRRADVRDEAALWVVRERGGDGAAAGLDAWLARDPSHGAAYAQSAWIWGELDQVARTQTLLEAPLPAAARAISRRSLIGGAVAAAGALAIGLPWLMAQGRTGYSTRIGEQRIVELEDGSRLTLNTDTAVNVRFGDDRRELELLRGEALFEVAHDASRPFVVTAANRAVKALGTSFVVRRHTDWVEVTLLSGRVEVSGAGEVVALSPGQRLRQDIHDGKAALDQPRMEAVIAWCDGQLLLDETPLSHAVAEMNRYQIKPIVLKGRTGDARLSGVFRTGESRTFARTLATMYGLAVRETPEAIVVSGNIDDRI